VARKSERVAFNVPPTRHIIGHLVHDCYTLHCPTNSVKDEMVRVDILRISLMKVGSEEGKEKKVVKIF